MCSQKEKKKDECDLPEIRAKFPDGICSKEQMIKCHGYDFAMQKLSEKSQKKE